MEYQCRQVKGPRANNAPRGKAEASRTGALIAGLHIVGHFTITGQVIAYRYGGSRITTWNGEPIRNVVNTTLVAGRT
jgi:hypothetical protein